MRIVCTGGTGFVGVPLCVELTRAGHSLQVLTRRPEHARRSLPAAVEPLIWNPARPAPASVAAIQAADAVVNLAGESIAAGVWSPRRKAAILSSRLVNTAAIVQAMADAPAGRRAAVLVSASAIGYYGDGGEAALTEASPPGDTFLARVCVDWEAAARRAETLGVRVVLARLGIVFGPDGGALAPLVLASRAFAGGPLGSGRQWWSWVHRDDVLGVLRFAVEHESARGPLNVTAPAPARMGAVAAALGRVLRRPSLLPAPAVVLRLMLGEMADAMILSSQRVLPAATQAAGYQFRYPELDAALRAVLGR